MLVTSYQIIIIIIIISTKIKELKDFGKLDIYYYYYYYYYYYLKKKGIEKP